LPILESNELNKEWITGIRKWWKQWVAKSKAMSRLRGKGAYPRIIEYLNDGLSKIDMVTKDLVVEKGLWPHGLTLNKKVDLRFKINPMVPGVWKLDDVREVIENARSHIQYNYDAIYVPGSLDYQNNASSRDKKWGKSGDMDALDAYIDEWIGKSIEEADKIFSGKFLKGIASFVGRWEGSGFDPVEPGIDLDFSIGRVKVLIQPTPSGKFRPTDFSAMVTKRIAPAMAKEYLRGIHKARALLEKSGFGRAWYGSIVVRPHSTGFDFVGQSSGKQYRSAGHYISASDTVVLNIGVYNKDEVARVLLHELGHRWYYRIMTSADRAGFDSYFNKVLAVQSYGSENPAEDFATVFEYYVMGNKLTRDQRERFKEFAIKGKGVRRMESLGG